MAYKKNETVIPLQIIDLEQDGFHPLLNITLFNKEFVLVLDTGASKTAFDQTLLRDADDETAFHLSDRLSTGLGTNTMASSTAVIRDMYIGNLLMAEFEVAVLDLSTINIAYEQLGHPQVLGVLGGNILMKYKAVINYGKSVLILKAGRTSLKRKKLTKFNSVLFILNGLIEGFTI